MFLFIEEFKEEVNNNFYGGGAGLTIVKKLCDILGFSYKYRRNEIKGSTFSIYIPTINEELKQIFFVSNEILIEIDKGKNKNYLNSKKLLTKDDYKYDPEEIKQFSSKSRHHMNNIIINDDSSSYSNESFSDLDSMQRNNTNRTKSNASTRRINHFSNFNFEVIENKNDLINFTNSQKTVNLNQTQRIYNIINAKNYNQMEYYNNSTKLIKKSFKSSILINNVNNGLKNEKKSAKFLSNKSVIFKLNNNKEILNKWLLHENLKDNEKSQFKNKKNKSSNLKNFEFNNCSRFSPINVNNFPLNSKTEILENHNYFHKNFTNSSNLVKYQENKKIDSCFKQISKTIFNNSENLVQINKLNKNFFPLNQKSKEENIMNNLRYPSFSMKNENNQNYYNELTTFHDFFEIVSYIKCNCSNYNKLSVSPRKFNLSSKLNINKTQSNEKKGSSIINLKSEQTETINSCLFEIGKLKKTVIKNFVSHSDSENDEPNLVYFLFRL